jgi:hypothetical protein
MVESTRRRPLQDNDSTVGSEFFEKIFKNQMDMFEYGAELIIEQKLKSVSSEFGKSKAFNNIFKAVGDVSKGVFSAQGRGDSLAAKSNIDFVEKEMKKMAAKGELDEEQLKYLKSITKELKSSNKHQLKNEHSISAIVKKKLKEKIPSITGILAAVGLDNPAVVFAGELIQDIVDERRKGKKAQQDLLVPYKQETTQDLLEKTGHLNNREFGPEQGPANDQEAFTPFLEAQKEEAKQKKKDESDALIQNNEIQTAYEKLIAAMISLTENTISSSDVYQESVKAYKEALDQILSLGGASPDLRGMVSSSMTNLEGGTPESAEAFAKMNEEIFKLIAINELHLPSMDKNIEALTRESSASRFADIEREREAKIENERLLDALDNLDNDGPAVPLEGKKGFFGKLFDGMGGIGTFLGFLTGGGLASIGASMTTAMAALLPMIPAILGVLGAITIIATGIYGAFEGWNNAADNLGKEADKLTTSDKIASAIGGFYGKIWSIVDWVGEQFGFDFGLEKFLTKDFSKFLADKFDLIKSIFKFIVEAPEKIISKVKSIYEWIVALPGKVETQIQEWIVSLPSFSELGEIALAKINEFVASVFTFEFPEIDFGFTDFINDTYNKIVEWFEELFSIENLKKKVGNAISETGNVVVAKFNAAKEGVSSVASSAKNKAKELVDKVSDTLTGNKPEPIPLTVPSDKVEFPEQEGVVMPNITPKRKGVFKDEPWNSPGGEFPLPLEMDKASELNDTKTNMVIQDSINKEKEKQMTSSAIINAPRTTNVNNSTSQSTQITQGLSPREMDNTFRAVQYQYR